MIACGLLVAEQAASDASGATPPSPREATSAPLASELLAVGTSPAVDWMQTPCDRSQTASLNPAQSASVLHWTASPNSFEHATTPTTEKPAVMRRIRTTLSRRC